jgi:hypothetical protein
MLPIIEGEITSRAKRNVLTALAFPHNDTIV